jgi:hypothetical protein
MQRKFIFTIALALTSLAPAWCQSSLDGTVIGVVQGGVKLKTSQGRTLIVPRTMRFQQSGSDQWFGNLRPGSKVSVQTPARRREVLLSSESKPQAVAGTGNAPWLGYYLPSTEYVYVPINSTEAYLDNNYNNPYSYVYQNNRPASPPLSDPPTRPLPSDAPSANVGPAPATPPASTQPVAQPGGLNNARTNVLPASAAPSVTNTLQSTAAPLTGTLVQTATGSVNRTTQGLSSGLSQTTTSLITTTRGLTQSVTGTLQGATQSITPLTNRLLNR